MIQNVEDALSNKATFEYASSRRLSKITDGAGRETTLNSSSTLPRVYITTPGKEVVRIFMSEEHKHLLCVRDNDYVPDENENLSDLVANNPAKIAGSSAYTYTGNLLQRATNQENGIYVRVFYYAREGKHCPRRVSSVRHRTSSMQGNERAYEYNDCVTYVTDKTVSDGKVLTYQFNDYGNVIGAQDEAGYASFASFDGVGTPN